MKATADLTPTEIIQSAAERLAGHMAVLRDAHDDHQIAPGPHDNLTSAEYTSAAELVYRETLSDAYLRRIGMTFGAVVVLMDLVSERQPERTTQLQWMIVRGYMAATADRFSPGYEAKLSELPSLVLATQATPPIVRFDLLAGLASRAAVLRTFDAASWVAELAGDLPDLSGVELDSVSLAALAASYS
jgi:hypothetical protein